MTSSAVAHVQSCAPAGEEPPPFIVNCRHKCPAKLLIARTEANYGRKFYCCYKGRDEEDDCKFFKWVDQLSGPGATARPLGSTPNTPQRETQATPQGTPSSPLAHKTATQIKPESQLARSPLHLSPDKRRAQSEMDSDEDDFFSSQGSPRSGTPVPHVHPNPPWAVQERAAGSSQPKAQGTPKTPHCGAGETATHVDFLNNLLPSVKSANADAVEALISHLHRQDRRLAAASKKAEYREKRIEALETKIHELEAEGDVDVPTEIRRLKAQTSAHEAKIAAMENEMRSLRGSRSG